MAEIPAVVFRMGTNDVDGHPQDWEGPVREVELDGYRISRHAVTNDQFEEFVNQTGYKTEAERYGWSFVFHLLLPANSPPSRGVAGAEWWRQVYGADWQHPQGPGSDLAGIGCHPVVHVSWNDAAAYCSWRGVRLPTEAEWECAARGGLEQARYPWGDEFTPDGTTMCNVFEGEFPNHNTCEDGYLATAPADSFPPNGYGLFNTSGNVWEWCSDWFNQTAHKPDRLRNPKGPMTGTARVIKGGSYLCHDSYCNRYRVAARSSSPPDSATGHLGFRVAGG